MRSEKRASIEHRTTPMMGRSHGIHAEPTTFGVALAGHLAEFARGLARLLAAREEIAVGKIAGAVGTYAHLSLEIEADALGTPGSEARDGRHADRGARSARGAPPRPRARRGGHRAPRDERAALAAHRGQRGRGALHRGPEGLLGDAPQAQPHPEREPLRPRARRARGRRPGARERGALARARHQPLVGRAHDDARRDLHARLHARSHQAPRRRARRLPRQPEAQPRGERRTLGFSEGVLLALVGKGMARQAAYVLVQRNAMRAFAGEGHLRRLPRGGPRHHEQAQQRRDPPRVRSRSCAPPHLGDHRPGARLASSWRAAPRASRR
jgi:adenylosuccinate lyase